MDTNKTNTQKLEAKAAKAFATQYKQKAQNYLLQVCEADHQLLDHIRKVLLNPDSYECKKVTSAAQALLSNIMQTGNLPHHRINSIADLIDESKTNLYPLNQLTFQIREELKQLCTVASEINAAISKHSDTDLFDLLSAWEIPPLKGRANKKFSFNPKE